MGCLMNAMLVSLLMVLVMGTSLAARAEPYWSKHANDADPKELQAMFMSCSDMDVYLIGRYFNRLAYKLDGQRRRVRNWTGMLARGEGNPDLTRFSAQQELDHANWMIWEAEDTIKELSARCQSHIARSVRDVLDGAREWVVEFQRRLIRLRTN